MHLSGWTHQIVSTEPSPFGNGATRLHLTGELVIDFPMIEYTFKAGDALRARYDALWGYVRFQINDKAELPYAFRDLVRLFPLLERRPERRPTP